MATRLSINRTRQWKLISLRFSVLSLLSQARLRLMDTVEKADVNEAMRLMEMSKDSLNGQNDQGARAQSITDQIFSVIREIAAEAAKEDAAASKGPRVVKMTDARDRCLTKVR